MTGKARSDVPVVFTGGPSRVSRTVYTNRHGLARAPLPAGVYRVEIPVGCTQRLIVGYASNGGRIGIPEGETVRIPALQVEATRRYRPAGAVDREDPPWKPGQLVAVRFHLFDACTDRYAPRQRFDDLAARAVGHIEIVRAEDRSDEDARATITIRCRSVGDARLELYDPQNPSDVVDVLALSPAPFGMPWCRS